MSGSESKRFRRKQNMSEYMGRWSSAPPPHQASNDNDDDNSKNNAIAIRRQTIMVLLANFGVISAGIAIGLPTVTMDILMFDDYRLHLSIDQFSWFASINLLSTLVGCGLNAYVVDHFGRKITLLISNFWILIGWISMCIAFKYNGDNGYMILIFARVIIGMGTGMASNPPGIYAAEISQPKYRGRFITATPILIALGTVIVYATGFFLTPINIRIALVILCIYQFLAVMCIVPLLESPNWLISKNRYKEALRSLNYFRGFKLSDGLRYPFIELEYNVLINSIASDNFVSRPFHECVALPEVYRPLILMIILFALQNLSGSFILTVFAAQIAMEADVPIDPFICATLLGLTRLITTIYMTVFGLLDYWGRRKCLLVSCGGTCISMLIIAICQHKAFLELFPYITLISIICYTLLSTLGLFTLPFIMISEVFPQYARGAATSIVTAVGMLMNFTCIKMYVPLSKIVENDWIMFAGFSFISFIGIFFVYFLLPETRGHALDSIQNNFRTQGSVFANRD